MNTFLCWFSISFDTINHYCLIPCTTLNFDLVGWSLWVIESSAQTVCVQTYSLPLPNLHKISAPWSEFRLKLQSLGPVQCHGNFSIRQSISDKCACKPTSPRNFSLKTWPRISVNLHSESEGIPVPNSTSPGICAIACLIPSWMLEIFLELNIII